MQQHKQYLVVNQTRDHEPDDYENLLGDGLERAFASGIDDLDSLVQSLNEQCVPAPKGQPWTAALLSAELKRLGA